MALFSVSDIVIAGTLFANALALLSSKLPASFQNYSSSSSGSSSGSSRRHSTSGLREDEECLDEDRIAECMLNKKGGDRSGDAHYVMEKEPLILRAGTDNKAIEGSSGAGPEVDLKERLLNFFSGFRRYSCVVVIWNFVFVVLMTFVFS